jgi:hypothetical protein
MISRRCRGLPSLRGRKILIVESELKLLHELIDELENSEGAETFYVRRLKAKSDAKVTLFHATRWVARPSPQHRRASRVGAIVAALKATLGGGS